MIWYSCGVNLNAVFYFKSRRNYLKYYIFAIHTKDFLSRQ